MPIYAIGAVIGAWVGRAIFFVFSTKLGSILAAAGLAITTFGGVSYIVGQVESAIASAFSGSIGISAQGVPIGQFAWAMFKLAGGGDAALMIVAAYVAGSSIAASRVLITKVLT